ncbi:MAG TPA: RusA family crossover junction endodeoxyribonuclease [Gemmataceae bacterium]|nr:RusA family crossover junction endodeoxyribonuclease [Gemmataceae bacterium]
MYEFVVPGIPIPQGSKQPWGAEVNPHVKAWRQTIAAAATDMIEQPLSGAIAVAADFIFPRPKNHYGTGRNAEKLKVTAPLWHTHAPDLDKLCRAVGDAFKGVVVRDDSQIARWTVVKRYGPRAQAKITVRTLS